MGGRVYAAAQVPHNKQLQRTVERHRARAAELHVSLLNDHSCRQSLM
jgi:hypothetical protein